MSQAHARHPSKEQLTAFLTGRLAAGERAQVERHIATCASCCQALKDLPDETLQDNLRAGGTPLDPFAAFAQGAHANDLPRELIGHPRYRVIKQIGKGGMGEVYLAEHRLMERMVALKVIHRSITRDPRAVERFRIEVKAAARLSHPNIVTAHDAEQAADVHFLAMEYIEGTSLALLVEERGPLAIADACQYVSQAALGLQHAHEHGMVHRDIKPQNLMLTPKGQIKILDFGLARFARGIGTGDGTQRITEFGAVMGTPDYIAPEQVSNARETDIRGDIYSLGCTLYFLLTGQTPFPTGTKTQKILAHLDRTPHALTSVRAQVPAKLAQIVEKMMAKDPAQRYATPREVAQALTAFSKNAQRSAAAAPPPRQAEPPRPTPAQSRAKSSIERPQVNRTRRVLLGCIGMVILVGTVTGLLWMNRGTEARKKDDVIGPDNKNLVDKKAHTPRVLMVLTHKGFWDPDYSPVRAILEQKGIAVKVASTALTPATPHRRNAGETPAPVDLLLSDARATDFDAIYFVGAEKSDYVGDQPGAASARKLIKEMLAAKKHVSALCTGVVVLADSGELNGKPAARSKMLGMLYADAALWDRGTPVVVSGTIITGGDFEHGPALATLLARELTK